MVAVVLVQLERHNRDPRAEKGALSYATQLLSTSQPIRAPRCDVVLVTELSRWGRSTLDLLHTLQDLEAHRVSVLAMSGLAFDLSTPHGRMMATILADLATFARE